MHSSSYLTAFAVAATTVLARPAPILSEATSAIDNYAATASASIDDYIENGIGGLTDDVEASIDEAAKSYPGVVNATSNGINSYSNRNGSREGWGSGSGRGWGNGGWGNGNQQEQQECMSREDALNVAGTFQSLIQGYTVGQALAALTPDFVDYSSAVSIIINRGGSGPEDVTAPIFTSREEFMRGHGTQEPIPFETLKVWSTRDGVVSMVWRSIRSGQGQENESAAIPVTGTAVLETEPTSMSTGEELERALAGGYNYRIHTLWSEFNTAAWLVNNGVLNLEPEVPVTPVPDTETTPSPPTTITKRGQATSKFDVGLA